MIERVDLNKAMGVISNASHPHFEEDGSMLSIGMSVGVLGPRYVINKIPVDPDDEICEAFVKKKLFTVLTTYGASFIVVFINMFFTTLMDKSGTFEKHQSLDDMESSNMTRLFLLTTDLLKSGRIFFNVKDLLRINAIKAGVRQVMM